MPRWHRICNDDTRPVPPMIERSSLGLPLVLLALLAGLSFWIERAVRLPSQTDTAGTRDPEGIIEDFDALRTDATGKPQYRLSAKRLKHYSGSRRTEMESPRFEHGLNPRDALTATAQTATISADGREVDLRGSVALTRVRGQGSSLGLTTARLLIYPEREMLRAPGAVILRDNGLDVRAGAMEYLAKQRLIKLTGRVHARYHHAQL